MTDSIERLTALFERFPGIGPRQAGRFVQYLLRISPSMRRELIESVRALGESVHQCPTCMRYHSEKAKTCSLCSDTKRDTELLAIVASDADLAALEKSGTYKGRYFVLGGTLSLGIEKTNGLRIKQLLDSLPSRTKAGLQEIILAFPANPEGDATAAYVRDELKSSSIKVTMLGRGLSTGSELEYADPETIKNALESRR
ncbi:hypothetical protein A2853_02595 [Candidatus Kaiserbacteria bacterium RIFCSPHIGHO2_01_FULL_55_17]|uniref:Recombination protein RecR n=1 Tax=Candidatus Kaiserbacteria bacterium RIFCSPHIGHO2_01_FULL_55_17 TaxID=1798484 RepID=A0A1F6D8P8_9BACT|nr:MAG: hypothetical protein A2853_02595 [Candidatus Kaiserbacteria bacterium RIFCSPHIGHO2_01_FULL_55_17]